MLDTLLLHESDICAAMRQEMRSLASHVVLGSELGQGCGQGQILAMYPCVDE